MANKKSPEATKMKQDYVVELLKADPAAKMNAIGKKVTAKFGTQLAFGKLREAFLNAGGKIDTSRKPGAGKGRKAKAKRGRKPAAKGATKKAAPTGKRAEANLKREMVAELVKSNPGITMNEVSTKVFKKFKSRLSFAILRESFKKAGGTIGSPGRKPGSKNRRKPGRRKSDRVAARTARTLGAMPRHIVVVTDGRQLDTREFKTFAEASKYTRQQVAGGVATSNIGYYERKPISVPVEI